MKTIEHLLTELGRLGITLSRAEDRLLVKAPKGAMTKDLATKIRDHKADVLAFMAEANASQQTIPKAPAHAPLTMSFAQQRMWFLDQLEGGEGDDSVGGAHYNIPLSLRLKGRLNHAALELAFSDIVMRHQALRTFFPTVDGEANLKLAPAEPVTIPITNLTQYADPEAEAKAQILQNATTGFNLATGPLYRCNLYQLDQHSYAMLVNLHHIISDGWSNGILVRELAQLYPYYCQNPRPTHSILPALKVQYSDFAHWQQQKLTGAEREKQLSFWEKTLAGIPNLHQIPSDFQRPRVLSYRGSATRFDLDTSLSQDLAILAKTSGSSMFMLLEAAFAVLLGRYSGQQEIVIGTPIANRNHSQLEPLIGLFVNTLVIRNSLQGDPSFLQFLDRVKTTALAAFDHQDMPFEQILERLDPERNLSYAPVFQVMFSLANMPQTQLQLPDLELSPFSLGLQTSKFDLNLTMGEHGNSLSGTLEYSTDLFKPETIDRMINHFKELLKTLVATPHLRLSRLSFLTPSERCLMLETWNATDRPFAHNQCIHQLFEAQVLKTPHATALVDATGKTSLTYLQLDDWANKIAAVLQQKGIRPWTRVGLMIERSPEMLAGVYGILKAGGAYVPIDPTYPPERIAYILEDSQAPVVLTKSQWQPNLEHLTTDAICLDHPLPETQTPFTPATASADDLIYIIYTSGSTGQPKGAGVFHRSFVNMVQWFIDDFQLTKDDAVLLTSSVSFDLTQKNMYAPLLVGGSIHLAPSGVYDPTAIAELVANRHITWLNCTPSAFYPLIEDSGENWSLHLEPLRWVFLGGEPISMARLKPWLVQPNCHAVVVNTYGPTECTDISNSYPMPEPMDYLERATPIGRAVHNVRLLILDNHQELLPLGGLGELCIYGVSVGPGYLKDPKLTAQKFLPNPHSKIPGDRLYRTGDLVRYLSNGPIEFIGRIDHQIKIRGFRIELGEIEAALGKMPEVVEAVALVKTAENGQDKWIVAFVLLEDNQHKPPFEDFLARHLPDYMVPHFFEVMSQFPLTPSGKIDRSALATQALSQDPLKADFVEPEGETEQAIAAVFADVLNRTPIGATTSFFRLGGHSLLATRVTSRLRDLFQSDLSLQALFEAPTVRGLATKIKNASPAAQTCIPVVSRSQILPLSYSQERLWFLYQLEGASATYNMPHAFTIEGDFALPLLEQAYGEVVVRHENLRTRFLIENDQPRLVIDPQLAITIALLDLSDVPALLQKSVVSQLRDAHGLYPFQLEQSPLHKLTCLRLAPQTHVLLLNLHHIISDGWSESLLMREMITIYHSLRLNQSVKLPALPIQYADYAFWQKQQLESEQLSQQLAYWVAKLGDGPAPLSLPTDYLRPAVRSFKGSHCHTIVDRETTQRLKNLASDKDATLFMVLLAGFYHLLARHSGMHDISVGTPIAGRNRPETEPLIGMFLNSLVLRADLSDSEHHFDALLSQVRQLTLEAYAHQEIPFEKLLEILKPERDLSRTPLFQVFFNMLNLPEVDDSPVDDLRFKALGNPEIGSKFDLTLYIAEQPEGTIGIQLHFNADLFTSARMAAFLNQYGQLLSNASQQPLVPMKDLSLNTPATLALLPDPLKQLNTDWQGPAFGKLAHWAQCTPEKTAITGNACSMSYLQLEQTSNALAHWLIENRVQKGDSVVIYAARCTALPLAMIAILKAGATFTILDPAYPADRLRHYAAAVNPKALIHLKSAGELRFTLEVPATITLPANGDAIALRNYPQTPPKLSLGPNDAACITFTSGSMGQPKAIIGRHGSLTHFMPWLTQRFAFHSGDHFSMLSGLAHDPIQRDVFTPLWLGASLHVPNHDTISPDLLFEWMAQQAISVAHLTPAMVRLMAEAKIATPLHAFRLAFVTGDVLTTRDVKRLRTMAVTIEVVNFYGTTETQRAVGYTAIAPDTHLDASEAIGIGQGVPDVQLLILNQANQLTAVGEIGDICLRSPHLALGYANDAELTAQKFVDNPFLPDEKASFYRTGDLGYYQPNGTIAFVGRADGQVQIRGYRIEIPEIEGVLAATEEVDEAAVLHFQPEIGDAFLVAYLQSKSPQPESLIQQTRLLAKQKLPSFMVPSHFLVLRQLPLTPNGKLNRAALRKQPLPKIRSGSGATAPYTSTEAMLAPIWQEILQLEAIPKDANFFDMGGHSLSATRVISRIRDGFGVLLPLRSIFEAPTLQRLAAKIDASKRQERQEPPLVAMDRGNPTPLSLAQTRLWFLDRFESHSSAYNMHFALRLEGHLDLNALKNALTAVYARQEALRTQFYEIDGSGFMRFREPDTFQLKVLDIAQDDLEAHLGQEAQQPFDLLNDVLFRATLLRLSAREHVLLISLHHIVGDGWSLGILSREITHCYQAEVHQKPHNLPELPIQYGDFAIWQTGWLQGAILERQLAYWREQLHEAPSLLDLPTDHPRPKQQTFNGERLGFEMDAVLTKGLNQLARDNRATLFMVLEASFALLLSRYADTEDVLIGTPIANRARPETEGLVGLFVNTLVIRNQLSGNPSFVSLLQRVRQTALDAYAHQDVPFEKVIDAVKPERNLGTSPLFQVMMVLQNLPVSNQSSHELTIESLKSSHVAAKFDITLTFHQVHDRLMANFEFNTALFTHQTIKRKITHFQNLLRHIVQKPQQSIANLSLFQPDALPKIMKGPALPAFSACVHRQIEQQVLRTPHAIALRDGDNREWTYQYLNRAANGIAELLLREGINPCDALGIFMPRCLEMVATMLAIHKCGAAYVPLDSNYPAERTAWMQTDSNMTLVVSLSANPNASVRQLVLPTPLPEHQTGPRPLLHPEQLSHLIYTSGSTGKPKAVAINHRATAALIQWAQTTFSPQELSGVLAATSICFDLSFFELFAPLTAGGTVILAENVLSLEEHSAKEQVRLINSVPSAMTTLVANRALPKTVQTVTLAGEPLKGNLVEKLYQLNHVTKVYNLYGPSEDTTYSTEELVPANHQQEPTIGTPIMGTTAMILGHSLEVLPASATGALYLSGAGLARGYLGQPGKTAEAFIPHPYANGCRLYKTGDRVKRDANGKLCFLGRRDHQVKLRGYRIELGEIEAAINHYPDVLQSRVLVSNALSGGQQLVAFCDIKSQDSSATIDALKAILREKLPNYMVPTSYLPINTWPTTPSGKLDTKALMALAQAKSRSTPRHATPPGNKVEQTLYEIWSTALNRTTFGVEDNFFEIGGDSILSLRIIAQAREAGLRVTPKQIFQFPTIRSLSQALNTLPTVAIDAQQDQVEGRVALTPIQSWFLDLEWTHPNHFNQSLLFSMSESIDPQKLEAAFRAVIHHHDALRLRFSKHNNQWQQVHQTEALLAFEYLDLTAHNQPAQAFSHHAAQLQANGNLETGPLVRVLFCKGCPETIQDKSARLLIVIHHLVVDGISWRILLEDLVHAYSSPQTPLPAKTTSFKAWSQRLHRLQVTQQERTWWRQLMSQPVKSITPDFQRPAHENNHRLAQTCHASLDPEATQKLLGEVHKAYRTQMDDVLLAALAASIRSCFGQSTVMVDLEGHGREHLFDDVDLSRTVGWFTSLYPVRLEANPNNDLAATLKKTKELLRSVPQKGIGFGILHHLQARFEAFSPSPLVFNYLGQTGESHANQQLFGPASETVGLRRSPEDQRTHLLECNAIVTGGQLRTTWTYPGTFFKPETIEQLAKTFIQSLETLVTHCCTPGVGGFTPSDFPLATLPQNRLDLLLGQQPTIEDLYPLSPMQEGMLFHALSKPYRGDYFEQTVLNLEGRFNPHAFKAAWQQALRRFPVLRTSFQWLHLEQPLQCVHRTPEVPMTVHDFTNVTQTIAEEKLRTLQKQEKERGFELDALPLMRLHVVKYGQNQWHILWCFHHILLDGWSSALVFRDVMAGYARATLSNAPTRPQPQAYKNYIAWLGRQDKNLAARHWQQTLGGFSQTTPLPYAQPFNQSLPRTLAAVECLLDSDQQLHFEAFVKKLGLTPFTAVQAAWALLLAAHSQSEDVVFGTIVSGRPAELVGVETMVGLFINALPVRIKLATLALEPWLKELQTQHVENESFAYTPLVDAQSHSNIPSNQPLFESLLVFENYPTPGSDGAPAEVDLKITRSQHLEQTQFPLVLIAVPGKQLRLKLGYDSRQFRQLDMQTLLHQLVELLAIMAEKPHQLVPKLAKKMGDTFRGLPPTNLTENQMLIWLGQKLEPSDLSYHNLVCFKLNGQVNPQTFKTAFEAIVRASDAMRTVFREVNGTPQRLVLELIPSAPAYLDFSQDVQPTQAYKTWLETTKSCLLDLEQASYETVLCKIADNHYVWFLRIHQLTADGEAIRILYQEVSQAYSQLNHQANCLEITTPAFEAYAEQEHAYQESKHALRDSIFWQQKLTQAVDPLSFYGQLPTRLTAATSIHDDYLEKAPLQELDRWLGILNQGASSHNSRVNFFIATFAIYLAKVSGKPIVTIGIPIHNRRTKSDKHTLGSFMHVLPLRMTVLPKDTVLTLMEKAKSLSFEALRYGRAVLPNPKHTPIYDVILNYHLSQFDDFAGMPMDFSWVHPGSGHLAMTFQISDFETDHHLKLSFECNSADFSTQMQCKVLQHYRRVMEHCIQKPEAPFDVIQISTPDERLAIQTFQSKSLQYQHHCVPNLIAECANKLPQQLAAVSSAGSITYGELQQRSQQLACQLIELDVQPEDRVGVCMSKSPELLVTLLAVLKAGAAFLPLDPNYPEDRLDFMIADSGCKVVLTNSSRQASLPVPQGIKVLTPDSLNNPLTAKNLPGILPNQAAYVVYTSGSTGRPKGVVVSHQSLVHAFQGWHHHYDMPFGKTVHLQMAGFSFDVFAGDFVRALCSGGTLVLVEKQELLDPQQLCQLIQNYRVTHAEFVPAILRPVAQYLANQNLSLDSLKLVAAGSDTWFGKEYLQVRNLLPVNTRLINSYGVSEATIDSCFFETSAETLPEERSVPIGQPFPNTQLYVLDSSLQQSPLGVAGELFIGGDGLARGYLNQPGLTAQRFIPSPFGNGARLYKTGDSARLLPETVELEFLGRVDFQVKIRGFRVEPGEIEGVLAQLEGVQAAIVMIRERSNHHDQVLVAHVQPEQGADQDPSWLDQLKINMARELPEHMIPSHIDVIPTLPLTPNGKIDRKGLLARPLKALVSSGSVDPARNAAETRMVTIWEQVLGKKPIGIHANFFELGGHSLSAVRLLAQCREHFQRPLQLPELFSNPTPALLVALLEDDSKAVAHPVALQPKGNKQPLFLVHAVGGGVASYQPLAAKMPQDRPIYAIHADFHQPQTQLPAMATDYIALIKKIAPHGPYQIGGWSMGGTVAYEMARQLRAKGDAVENLILIDSMPSDQMGLGNEFGEADIMASYVNQLARNISHFAIEAEDLRECPEEQRLAFVIDQAKQAKILPQEAELTQLQQQWEMFRNNALASHNYQPTPLPGKLHLIRAEELDLRLRNVADNGWGRLADEVVIHHQSGNHLSMVTEPHADSLAQIVLRILEGQP